MNVLLTAFEGSTNSAKIILDNLSVKTNCDKLYLKNNRDKCVEQLTSKIESNQYNIIVSFGQKPIIKNKIYIETVGKNNKKYYFTDFNYDFMSNFLVNSGYEVKISKNAGTSFCNHIFFNGLDYIATKNLDIKMVFVHVPFLKNIEDIDYMTKVFSEYINNISL